MAVPVTLAPAGRREGVRAWHEHGKNIRVAKTITPSLASTETASTPTCWLLSHAFSLTRLLAPPPRPGGCNGNRAYAPGPSAWADPRPVVSSRRSLCTSSRSAPCFCQPPFELQESPIGINEAAASQQAGGPPSEPNTKTTANGASNVRRPGRPNGHKLTNLCPLPDVQDRHISDDVRFGRCSQVTLRL